MSNTTDPGLEWLGRFPEAWQRSLVEYWFRQGIAQGATTPAALVAKVLVLIGQKREFSIETRSIMLCEAAAQALVAGRPGALQYAKSLLEGPTT